MELEAGESRLALKREYLRHLEEPDEDERERQRKELEAEERRLALERDLWLARQLEFERRVQERRAQDLDEYEDPRLLVYQSQDRSSNVQQVLPTR